MTARKRSIERGHEDDRRGQGGDMKSVIRSIGMAAGIVLFGGVRHAGAQIVNTVEFTTTFPFTVGAAMMPAGTYTIRQDDDNPSILQLEGAHTGVFFETTNVPALRPEKTEVVFKRYGNAYVLKDVYVVGSDTGAESVAAEGERHMSRKSGSPTEHHIVAILKSPATKAKQIARKK
jgi:hypothetical protein